MSEKKKLNEEQLESVTGGTNGTAEPEESAETTNESDPFADVPYTPDNLILNTDRLKMEGKPIPKGPKKENKF